MDGLPSLYTYGDQEHPAGSSIAHAALGARCSAASFVLAVEAMVAMAGAIGEHEDASSYRSMAESLRAKYEQQFWNAQNHTTMDLRASTVRANII